MELATDRARGPSAQWRNEQEGADDIRNKSRKNKKNPTQYAAQSRRLEVNCANTLPIYGGEKAIEIGPSAPLENQNSEKGRCHKQKKCPHQPQDEHDEDETSHFCYR